MTTGYQRQRLGFAIVLDFGIGDACQMALHLSNDSSQLKRVCHCCILERGPRGDS